jgi:hypothetical protein
MAVTFPYIDMENPHVRKLVVANLIDAHRQISPEFRRLGRQWYPAVEHATEKSAKKHFGRSMGLLSAAGITAAVSPNMDWDNHNFKAFEELAGLRSHEWDAIEASASLPGGRLPEVKGILAGKSISRAPDSNLVKAYRIMQGEHPERVLDPRSAPKTYSFMHNIAGNTNLVTIDGRAHDLGSNRMVPWTTNRGISSSQLPTGKPTRYEHFQSAYQQAAGAISEMGEQTTPRDLQGMTWEWGKAQERQGVTRTGQPRKVGVARRGQGYLPDRGAAVLAEPGQYDDAPALSVGRSREQRRSRQVL